MVRLAIYLLQALDLVCYSYLAIGIDSIYQGLLTQYKLFDLSRAVSVELLTPFL